MSAEISLGVDVNKSSVNASYRKIQEIFNDKPPILFNVDVRKSSINKAFATLRDEFANKKAVTVNVVPKMDVSKADFAGKNSVDRIKNYIQSLLKDVEVKLTPKFDMRSITASIRNMKQELNKVAGEETEVKANIVVNRSGNVGSPETLDSWLKSLRKFANFATKVPNGEINLRVNLGANIDAGFKQLIEGGFDLSKIKGGKLDINVNSGDSSSAGNSRRKGGNGKGTISDNTPDTIPEPQIIPAMTRSKIIEVINKRFNTDAKNLVEAIEKSSGINLSSAGRNIGVHIQSAMSKLAKEAEDRVIQGDKEGAQAIKNLVGKLRNMYAGQDPYLRETGKFTNLTDGQVINRYTKLATQDSNVSLDSGRYAQIDANNKERRTYLDNLKREQELFVKIAKDKDALWKHGAEQLSREIEALWETNKRLFKNNKSNPQVENKLAEVHNLQNRLASGDADVANAVQKYFANKAKEIANLLEYAKAENSEILEAFRISGMQGINTTKVFNNLNPLSHGEKLENLASQRANMSGDYWAGAEHKRKANDLRKERLDPLQKEIDDLIVARNKGEKSQLGTNPELLNLINTKLRLMSEIGGADFGLKQQIDYIKSLNNKNIDADAHGMLDKLLNQMNKELAESFRGTIEDRIKYYKNQISEAFKQIKDKAGRGEDVTSDVNKYMGFRSKLLEAQSQQSGGASADYSGASKGMLALSNIKGIDSKLLADIKQAEAEFRELAKAQSAAGDTAKKLSNEYEALKTKLNSVTSNGDISKIASKMESNLMARFGRGDNVTRDIQALSQMATALNSKGLDGEPIARLARRMKELSDEAKKVTQAEQQVTKAQTTQNQAVIEAEKELEKLARDLDNVYRSSSKIQQNNPFGGPVKEAADKYKQKLEEIYALKRQIGQLKTDGDAARELLGRSKVSGSGSYLKSTNERIQSIYESVAGRFGREEGYSRDRAKRSSFMDSFIGYFSYGVKFAGRSAKGSGSALEASAMGLQDAFNLLRGASSSIGKIFGGAGMVISAFTMAIAGGIEVCRVLFNVFERLIDVVYRLLQPGIELYTQVTKATYSMGAAIASNAKFAGEEISLTTGIATSAQLQQRAMVDAERSVFDFSEIVQSLSGTLPILLGRGMSLDQAYRTNMGVASVAKLTNLAPNQVLQETRDLAQGTITARSSQVANALGISSADLQGKSADDIFNFFMDKFKNYEDVLKQYAETPVGAFEQMMDRLRTVSMKFVEQIAYPFKEFFNWITDFTGTWVDKEQRTLTRIDKGDGTTEQYWLKDGGATNTVDSKGFTLQSAIETLGGDLYKLTDAIDRATQGKATIEDTNLLKEFKLDPKDLISTPDKKITVDDVMDKLFGDITKPAGNGSPEFTFSEDFAKLQEGFVDLFKYLASALDDILTTIQEAFGLESTNYIDMFVEAIKWLIDVTKEVIKVTIRVIATVISWANNMKPLWKTIGKLIVVLGLLVENFLITLNTVSAIGLALRDVVITAFADILKTVAKMFKLNSVATWADGVAKEYKADGVENIKSIFESHKQMGKDVMSAFGFGNKEKSDFFSGKVNKGFENFDKFLKKLGAMSSDSLNPKDVIGKPKPESDKDKEKREREARKAEKKAFDKYIAQLRDALERHIQELKDALDKNEAAYKQGLKNYDAYIQEKMKNELEEQVAKRDELLKEIEAIKSTGKYESEDEREKDLYTADKKLQSINKAIEKLTITQGEVTSILGESNQLLETLVGLNRSSNDKKDKTNSDINTKVETKEESLNTEDLLKYKDINDLDDKKSWAMQYFRESGFASDNASSMLAHTLTNSADLSGNIFGFDSETLNAYATKAGLNLSDATDLFKTNIMIATDKIKEAIPTDNDYTLDQFNAELKKLGMFIGEADLSVMNQLAQSFKPFMRQITTTTHTLANANGVVNQAVNGYKEGEMWKNPVKDWIPSDKMCDSWVGDVYFKSGVKNIGGIDIGEGSIITDQMFEDSGYWHGANSGYVPRAGDYISGAHHVGIVLDGDKVRSRDSTGGVRTWDRASWINQFGLEGYGEMSPFIGSSTNAIKDVVEKITRGTASTYTGNGLQAIEMKEKYLTTEFNLQAQLDKYEQTVFDSVEAASKSAEVIKKGLESQFDIFKTTGLNDKQQKRIVDKKERLMMFQIQELIGKQLKEQLEYQLSDIEALFNYDLTASASRVDYALITKNYQDIFTNMDNDIHRTINSIKEMIDKADAEGNRALGKDLRQALYKVTNKLNEFFDKAEDAVNKQYDYIESAMNNIGATNLQKEGLSKRFNIAKNRELAKVYRDKEVGLTAQYRELTERALKETKDLGEATGATLTAIADVQERLLKNRWALQQAEDLSKFKTSLEEANDVFKQALEDGLVDFMTDGVNAVLEGTKTIGEAFRELAVSILKTMQQFFAKKLIENLMNKLYPMDDDIKRITDTANWQPKDLLKNPQGEQTYKAQMDNPVLKPYMKEGYIIKNVPSDTTYGPIREPEYEAINPADALAQQLQKTSNSLGQFDSALWKFIDEANGKTIYPDEDMSQTKVETSANNLSVAMDNAATATTNNATTTAMNTATTEVNSNANTQATTTIQQKDSTERLNISATENDTDALNRHASALSNDTAPQVQTEGVDSVSGSGVDGGAGMQSPGSFKGNFLTSLMGSDFMQLAGGLFAVKTLFSGDTKEKLLSAIFIELQLMYVELIKLSSNLLTGLFGYASGGYISGPGTGTSDSIPAMLSNGEFVVKANAVKKYGTNFLDAVNNGTFATIKPRHHYASGGLVTETAREATSTVVTELGRGIGTNINNEAHFNLVMASNQEDAMKAFMRSPEGQRIYLDMARKYASTTVRF